MMIASILLATSCNNSKKAIVCKNEFKIVKAKQFKEPYSYKKINKKKVEKLHAQRKEKTAEIKAAAPQKEEVFASTSEEIVISKNPIRARVEKHSKDKADVKYRYTKSRRKSLMMASITFGEVFFLFLGFAMLIAGFFMYSYSYLNPIYIELGGVFMILGLVVLICTILAMIWPYWRDLMNQILAQMLLYSIFLLAIFIIGLIL